MAKRHDIKWLLGITATFILLLCSLLYYGVFFGRQPDQEAQPLTAEQLAQHPLFLPPAATGLTVTREIQSYGPDERRPTRSRYLRRVALFSVGGSTDEIIAFYQQAFTRQGWTRCFLTYQTPTAYQTSTIYAKYQRPGTNCALDLAEAIGFSIDQYGSRTYRVETWEILPAPLEWPEQQSTPTTTSELPTKV